MTGKLTQQVHTAVSTTDHTSMFHVLKWHCIHKEWTVHNSQGVFLQHYIIVMLCWGFYSVWRWEGMPGDWLLAWCEHYYYHCSSYLVPTGTHTTFSERVSYIGKNVISEWAYLNWSSWRTPLHSQSSCRCASYSDVGLCFLQCKGEKECYW